MQHQDIDTKNRRLVSLRLLYKFKEHGGKAGEVAEKFIGELGEHQHGEPPKRN